ncbi:MAG: pilus assembly protein [Chloroflexi bacterium]|nr:pilus assembly protein [Chloroflexota bacterium]
MNSIRSWRIRRTFRKQVAGRHKSGQAIVELALSVTFLAFLFAAAVDLGIAYKSYQTLMNATAEATTYLSVEPFAPCDGCTEQQTFAAADRKARTRFREEQGADIRGSSSTLDLDSNNVDDLGEHGWGWIEQRVLIDEADSTQIQVTGSTFAVGNSFTRTTNPDCLSRRPFDSNGRQCFIVVRSVIIYHPFAISPAVGSEMTIRAISVKPL